MNKERIIQEFVPGNRSRWRISLRTLVKNWRKRSAFPMLARLAL